jgi:hypothetical protein
METLARDIIRASFSQERMQDLADVGVNPKTTVISGKTPQRQRPLYHLPSLVIVIPTSC